MTQYSNTGSFSTGFSSQCFPVRSLANYKRVDEGGAWLVAYRAEQRRRFKAVLSNEPVCPVEPDASLLRKRQSPEFIQDKANKLDGFYLMRKFYVEDPSDLCSINISGSELSEVSDDDFLLFDNVVHVDAGDNNLPFDAFKNFISLRELEMPLNNISGSIRLEPHDFLQLEKLDLSYNRVTSEDILDLGLLPCLKTLHLTGNEIKRLPVEMARTYRAITGITLSGTVESEDRKVRFSSLENLFLDNNELTDISTFSSLAGLRRLKYLNLENNEIASIPHLRLLGARVRQSEDCMSQHRDQGNGKPLEKTAEQNKQQKEDEKEMEGEEVAEADKDELVLDEVDEMLSKKLPGDENDEMGNGMGMRHHSSTLTEDASLLGDKYHPPLPFPSLLHLNLANNMVFEEEGLFAVAGWPRLKELVIWGNPLTTAFKGDPPLLSIRLGKLKGVRIFRQKPVKRPKHHVNLSNIAGYRKVDDTLPPAPRKRDLLMLKSPSKPEAISYVGPHPRPLPPISAPSGTNGRPRSHPVTPRQLSTAPDTTHARTRTLKTDSRSRSIPPEPPQRSPDRGTVGHEVKTSGEPTSSVDTTATRQYEEGAAAKTQTDEGFFMTQVEEPESLETPSKTESPRPRKKKSRKTKHQHPDRPFSVETKYKGYEDLLDVDENDPDIIIPKGIQESVRSLQYTLQHPLVFTESQGNYKEKPKKKREGKKLKESRQNKVEELSKLLDKMRVENKIIESNLANVIQEYHKDPNIRKQFPKAKKLLDEVQAKYNEVRMKSLQPSYDAQRVLQPELVREPSEVESLGSSFLEEERQVLNELAKFKKRLDGRI